MARTIIEIKKEMTTYFMSNENISNIYGFVLSSTFENEFSKVSLESILFDIVSFCIWTLEKLFDFHKSEVDKKIYEQKSGTPRWYRNKAIDYQYGFDLIYDTDKFDNGISTIDEIENSKIIKYCSVKESQESNRLLMKIASEENGILSPLTETQKISFLAYMDEVKYAGVKINLVNNPADVLQIKLKVFRDPLVLDEAGNSILNGGKPLETAIQSYLKNLPFDGELIINDFIEKLRLLPGINNVHIISANSKYFDNTTNDYSDFEGIDIEIIPKAGYFEVENFNNIEYVV